MNNTSTTKKDLNQAEKIRRQYLSREANKMAQLQKLDSQVKAPGKIVAGVLGTVGALVLGGGMSMIMVNGVMNTGLALGIPGLLVALAAYPVYQVITGSRKKKYAAEVLRLSSQVAGE